jgi:hypothetical protein
LTIINDFRIGSTSPMPTDDAVEEEGKPGLYCAHHLEPGQYRMFFERMREESPAKFLYYPGVSRFADAAAIDVAPGHTVADLVFQDTRSAHIFRAWSGLRQWGSPSA